MRRLTPFVLVALSLLLVGGCVDRDAQRQAERTEAIVADTVVPVEVTAVQNRSIGERLEITGTITTSDDTQVGAKIPGRLVAVFVKDGDEVSAGQVIAQQDTTDLQTQVRQAQAAVDAARAQLQQAQEDARQSPERSASGVRAAQAQLNQARAALNRVRNGARTEERRQAEAQVNAAQSNLETARKSLERAKSLLQEGAVAQADVDQAQNGYAAALSNYQSALETQRMLQTGARPEDLAQAEEAVRAATEAVRSAQVNQRLDSVLPLRVNQARAGLTGAQETLQAARQALSDATLRSPFAGRVSGRPAQPGTYLGPGTPVARLVGTEGVYFEGDVPESRVPDIRPGLPVSVTLDALRRTVTGRIVALNPLGADVGRVFRVRIGLDSVDGIKPGMFARGLVDLGNARTVAAVPEVAILKDGEESLVYVVKGDTAQRVAVRPGLTQNGFTAVSDLRPGDQVVVRGQQNLLDGSKVRIGQPAAPTNESTRS